MCLLACKEEVNTKDFHDDGEPGAGRILLDLLEQQNMLNTVIFATREYGGIKMGADRFSCYVKSARTALGLDPEQPIERRRDQHNYRRSNVRGYERQRGGVNRQNRPPRSAAPNMKGNFQNNAPNHHVQNPRGTSYRGASFRGQINTRGATRGRPTLNYYSWSGQQNTYQQQQQSLMPQLQMLAPHNIAGPNLVQQQLPLQYQIPAYQQIQYQQWPTPQQAMQQQPNPRMNAPYQSPTQTMVKVGVTHPANQAAHSQHVNHLQRHKLQEQEEMETGDYSTRELDESTASSFHFSKPRSVCSDLEGNGKDWTSQDQGQWSEK